MPSVELLSTITISMSTPAIVLSQHRLDQLLKGRALVEDRHDHREPGRLGWRRATGMIAVRVCRRRRRAGAETGGSDARKSRSTGIARPSAAPPCAACTERDQTPFPKHDRVAEVMRRQEALQGIRREIETVAPRELPPLRAEQAGGPAVERRRNDHQGATWREPRMTREARSGSIGGLKRAAQDCGIPPDLAKCEASGSSSSWPSKPETAPRGSCQHGGVGADEQQAPRACPR